MRAKACCSNRTAPVIFALICATLFGSDVLSVYGAVRSWTGGGANAYWGTAENWAPAGTPQDGDDLVFPAGAARTANTNNLNSRTFNSITFNGAGGGFVLRGNAINLSGGISGQNTDGGNTVYIPISLASADQTFATTTATGTLVVEGNVNLNGHNLTLSANTGALSLGGVISGTGNLIKTNSGTLTLYGTSPNTYIGDFIANGGLVQLWKVPGPAVTGGVRTPSYSSTIRLLADNQLSDSGLLTLHGATLDLGGWTDTVGPLELSGSTVETGGGLLILSGNVTNRSFGGPAASVINGRVNLGAATRIIHVDWDRLTINADIEGALTAPRPGITRTGGGWLELAGNNTYYGTTTLNGPGQLVLSSNTALGDSLGETIANTSFSISLQEVVVEDEVLTLNHGGALGGNGKWSGNIVLNGDSELQTYGSLDLSGAIAGSGGLTCIGPTESEIHLSGTNANTYSGITTVNEGALVLSKSGVVAIAGPLVIGDRKGGMEADVVLVTQPNQISITSAVRVNNSGLLQLVETSSATIGSLTLEGGQVWTETGTLTLNGNVWAVASTNQEPSRINGRLSLGGATRIFDVAESGAIVDLSISAVVSDGGSAAGITKTSPGSLELTGANTYSGGTLLSAGNLLIRNPLALGSTATGTTVSEGATLWASIHVGNEPLVLNGRGMSRPTIEYGALRSTSASSSWAGPITIPSDAAISCGFPETRLELTGVISGSGSLAKLGPGTLAFTGASPNTWSGSASVEDGLLELGRTSGNCVRGHLTIGDGEGGPNTDGVRFMASDQIDATTAAVIVNSSGLLDLNGFSDSMGHITLNGGRITTGSGTLWQYDNILANAHTSQVARIEGKLILSGNRTVTVAGHEQTPDMEIGAFIYGNGSLTKAGEGVLSLTRSNAYTGFTRVNGGALLADNAWALGDVSQGTSVYSNAVLSLRGGIVVEAESLNLNSSQSPAFQSLFGSNTWAGPITLSRDTTIWVRTNDWLNLAGAIDGPGGLTKTGPGSMLFSGPSVNSYAGDTLLLEGPLELAKSGPGTVEAIAAGSLTIGDGQDGQRTVQVLSRNHDQIGHIPVVVNWGGTLNLNGYNDAIGPLTLDGGEVVTGTGLLSLGGDVLSAYNTNALARLRGRVSVLADTRMFEVVSPSFGSRSLIVDASVEGQADIVKRGLGSLMLNGSNSFTGPVQAHEGVVALRHAHAAGASGGGIILSNGSSLHLDACITNEPLVLHGDPPVGIEVLRAYGQSNRWTGPVSLTGRNSFEVYPDRQLFVESAIAGPGSLVKTGEGTLIFDGSQTNTFAGSTEVKIGTLLLRNTAANGAVPGSLIIGDGVGGANADVVRLEHYNQINNLSAVTINSSGLMETVSELGDAIGSLSGEGRVDLGHAKLYVGYNNQDTLFSGSITGLNACELNKEGTGTLTLNGTNTYPGWTFIHHGTLVINAHQPESTVSVGAAGTLSGTGVVGDLLSVGAIRPGSSPGRITCSNLVLHTSADLHLELNGPTPGTGYDQLLVRGSNYLANPFLHIQLGDAPMEGQVYTVLSNDGTDLVHGTFAALPEGSLLSADGIPLRLSYAGGDGNDITLTVADLPLRVSNWTLAGGNGNGAVDPDECNWLVVTLTNTGTTAIGGISSRVTPLTPRVRFCQDTSPFADLASHAVGTQTTPFQFLTAPDFSCGVPVDLVMHVTADDLAAFAIPLTLPSGGPGTAQRVNNIFTYTIKDGGRAESIISVPRFYGRLAKVAVACHISHLAVADLDLHLIAPNGTKVELSSDNGKGADYGTSCEVMGQTIFDDDAPRAITEGSSPFVGLFQPEYPLSVLQNINPMGPWTLVAEDDTVNEIGGTLKCWSLLLYPTQCPSGGGPCELCPDDFLVTGVLTDRDSMQYGQIKLDGVASQCGLGKPFPGVTGEFPRYYHAYTFYNGPEVACISVNLSTDCGEVFASAYQGVFIPETPGANYLADPGRTGTSTYGFLAGTDFAFTIVVSIPNTYPICGNYTLHVSGGNCHPRLNIQPVGSGKVTLDWTSSATGFELQQADTMPPDDFQPVPSWPTTRGGKCVITNSSTSPSRFFRLMKD